jgi:flavin reductase (DIM6/NTAB) family NADH-FMN oxidoreductase RutF
MNSTIDTAPKAAFDSRAFRDALGTFTTGVTVITTVTPEGEKLGTTASSFNSVSLDPPLVLFSMARNAKAFPAWQQARSFAVNILAEDQDELSARFARPLTDKWSDVIPEHGPVEGLPLLPGALVSMECTSYANYDGGDHIIMVGRVVSFMRRRPHARPLVFFGSRYRALDKRDDPEAMLGYSAPRETARSQ